jgi:hypothetical protein
MGLITKAWDSFAGGRCTRNNLLRATDDHFLIASNLIFPGDGVCHKRPGYTLVRAAPFAGVRRIYNFNRQTDQTPFVFLAGAGILGWMPPTGASYTQLSNTENANAIFDFVDGPAFEAYCSNGYASYRLVDVGGTLTKYGWGIAAPGSAPTIGTGSGSLGLVYGRTYAFSYVAKWTDSTGVQRVHVGPPSPISAFTGVINAGVVNLSAIAASADPQVTHIWIWATNDTPQMTTSALFFAAEITNGTTSWADSLADTSLDTTRLIPYDNQPAPLATILKQYQGRIVAMGIQGKPSVRWEFLSRVFRWPCSLMCQAERKRLPAARPSTARFISLRWIGGFRSPVQRPIRLPRTIASSGLAPLGRAPSARWVITGSAGWGRIRRSGHGTEQTSPPK